MIKKPIVYLIFLSIAIITLGTYLPALRLGFVNWDDGAFVYSNINIRTLNPGLLKWSMTAIVVGSWGPLSIISHAIDYSFWGLNPIGYHLTNIVLHAIITFFVARFVYLLCLVKNSSSMRSKEDNTRALIVASICALLFGLHPLHVESVAWVSERKDLVCALFFVLALTSYINYATGTSSKKALSYVLALVFFILSLLGKPMSVSLPLVLILLDYAPLKRLTSLRNLNRIILEKIPFFFFAAVASIIAMLSENTDASMGSSEGLSVALRIFVAFRAFIFYLQKLLWPTNLSPFYPFPKTIDFFTLTYGGSIIALIIITVIALRALKRSGVFPVIWFYYIITLLPVVGIIKVGEQAFADRYTYLPSIAPFILIGIGFYMLFDRSKKGVRVALLMSALIICALLGFSTTKQISIWEDSISLWSHVIKLSRIDHAGPYSNRGLAYSENGRDREAISDLNRALEIDPGFTNAYINRGLAYRKVGELKRAIKDYSSAIELNPGSVKAYNNRGVAYGIIGDYDGAIKDFQMVVELSPTQKGSYNNLKRALSLKREKEQQGAP